MQVKHFIIRPDSDNLEIDQNILNDFLENINFKKSDTHFVESEVNYWSVLVHYEEENEIVSESKTSVKDSEEEIILSDDETQLFEKLKKWRNAKAKELSLPHYMISHNSELKNVAVKKPNDKIQLRKIKGFGEIKAEKYSDEIISIVQNL